MSKRADMIRERRWQQQQSDMPPKVRRSNRIADEALQSMKHSCPWSEVDQTTVTGLVRTLESDTYTVRS